MSARSAVAITNSNIALSKYWGKREGGGNYPAVPSLSVTLQGMRTETRVTFDNRLPADEFVLNGEQANGEPLERATRMLNVVRKAAGFSSFARIVSTNDFPTASGLASSASGFAALALASLAAAELDWNTAEKSDLARRSSASSARSLFGGFVELDAAPVDVIDGTPLPARSVAPADHVPLVVLVAVVTEEKKSVGSARGMITTKEQSPYYAAWLENAPRIHRDLRSALLAKDLERVCILAEASALAMHASAIAAGVLYMHPATVDLLRRVRELRASGLLSYATMDAGPHVKVLTSRNDAARVLGEIERVPGVLRVLRAEPGGEPSVKRTE